MIEFRTMPDDEPALDHSKLLRAFEKTLEFAIENDGIGLTKSKAFNRKFATWAAENFDWPAYSAEKLLRVQKVLNEEDMPPVMVVHDLMHMMKLGRHMKDRFKLNKQAIKLSTNRGELFVEVADAYLCKYDHARNSRFEFTAPGNWDIFLNIINVESQRGLTEAHLVKTLYGIEDQEGRFHRDYQAHSGFLFSHVLQPLCWLGFLQELRESDSLLSKRTYWKTPLWTKCLRLDTDHYLETPTLD